MRASDVDRFHADDDYSRALSASEVKVLAGNTCYADCDADGDIDVFDFLCFQNAAASGCP